MKIFAQSSRSPSQVLFAFDEAVDFDIEQVRWAVAYSTRRGCERLVQRLTDRIGSNNWSATRKHFITSLDFGLTDPAALTYMRDLPNASVYVANPQLIEKSTLMPGRAFHPKVFFFESAAQTGYVIGSANLTESALITNTEVVTAGKEDRRALASDAVWDELMVGVAPLTIEILEKYKAKWVRPARREVEPEPKPVLPVVTPISIPVLWDAIVAKAVSPENYEHFWVDVQSVSGGSGSQIELPRGANRFFGFLFQRYSGGGKVEPIGSPAITFKGNAWTKPLRWHAHNAMERINLPTVNQGGFSYAGNVLLFRRRGSSFEITVSPSLDEEARAWKAASQDIQRIYRVGKSTKRICGFF